MNLSQTKSIGMKVGG